MAVMQLVLCLSEPRAEQLAVFLSGAGHRCVRLQLHTLEPLELAKAQALRLAALKPTHDVLLPVSPGAVGMLVSSLRAQRIEVRLEEQAWLCVGPGTANEVKRHDPQACTFVSAEGVRDLSSLLGRSEVHAWIGSRRVHLICSRARARGALERLPAWLQGRSLVYPVYTERWKPLGPEALQGLLQLFSGCKRGDASRSANEIVWILGSVALLQHLFAQLRRQFLAEDTGSADGLDAVLAGFCAATLICPHPRIAEAAKAHGHTGSVWLAAGPAEIQEVLARIADSRTSRPPASPAGPVVPAAPPRPSLQRPA